MAAGFKTYRDDPANTLLVDMTTTISMMVGFVDSNFVNGSVDVPPPPAGRQFLYTAVAISPNADGKGARPGITATNMGGYYRLSWAYGSLGGWGTYALNTRIHYGYT